MTANNTDVEIAIKQLEKAVEEGKLFNPEPLDVDLNTLQANVAEYNLKHHLPVINKNSKTIAQIEDVIINKYGGKKLDTDYFYNHLTDFFDPAENIDYLKSISPCHMIHDYTEEIIPDEYFYSFYVIPLAANLKCNEDHYKELIVFITSVDGKFVYASGILTFVINSLEYYSKLEDDIAYCVDDVPIYYDYVNGKFQDL